MAADQWIISYVGLDGQQTDKHVKAREDGWHVFTTIRKMYPDACLYSLRQEGLP